MNQEDENVQNNYEFENNYQFINQLIYNKQFSDAEKILREYNLEGYAKWHYAFAQLRFAQGWLNEAFENYRKAAELEPDNPVYRQAYTNICNMRDGNTRKSSNLPVIAIAVSSGVACLCCSLSLPVFMKTPNALACAPCRDCSDEMGCSAVCCEPCEDGISSGVNAYYESLCHGCCRGIS